MQDKRILYHGTTIENALAMLGSNFTSIVDETVWNCSDDDMLYLVEKDYDGEENDGLRFAAEAAQMAAAYLGSQSEDLVVLKFEIPEYMFEQAYIAEDYSTEHMNDCWQIEQSQLEESISIECPENEEIDVSVIVLHSAYNRELRPFYIPVNELLNEITDPLLRTAVDVVHSKEAMEYIYEDLIGAWGSEELLSTHDFLQKYGKLQQEEIE